MGSEWTTLTVDGSPMWTYAAAPDGAGPRPGVVVIQHISGVDSFITSVCDRLALEGYAAVSPNLYHRQEERCSLEDLLALRRDDPRWDEIVMPLRGRIADDEVVRDVNAAIAHMRAAMDVGDRPVGVTGFCMGGRMSYLMATRSASVRAAACFYPGNIFESNGGGPSPFAASDRITTHVAGFFGNDDANPTPADVARIDVELVRLGVEHSFYCYDGTGHGFMNPDSARSYREASARDAWHKLMELFEERLKAA